MSGPTDGGIRESLYFGIRDMPGVSGYLAYGQINYKEQISHAKASRALGNVRRVILRPYVPGAPFAIDKAARSFSLPRAAALNADLCLRLLKTDYIDFCEFKLTMDRFRVPTTGDFAPKLWRRPFISAIPSSAWPGGTPAAAVTAAKYPTKDLVVISGVPTIGTPTVEIADADVWGNTPITPSATPDPGSVYEVTYTACYYMEVQDTGGDDRTYPEPFREERTIALLEC